MFQRCVETTFENGVNQKTLPNRKNIMPLTRVMGPLPNGRTSWLANRGDVTPSFLELYHPIYNWVFHGPPRNDMVLCPLKSNIDPPKLPCSKGDTFSKSNDFGYPC